MTTDEVLVIGHVRQWTHDRCRTRNARSTSYKRTGYIPRRAAEADAALVRCIDFERALATLQPLDQTIIVMVYRDRATFDRTAIAAGCCTRTVVNRLPHARKQLAAELDRKGLL